MHDDNKIKSYIQQPYCNFIYMKNFQIVSQITGGRKLDENKKIKKKNSIVYNIFYKWSFDKIVYRVKPSRYGRITFSIHNYSLKVTSWIL